MNNVRHIIYLIFNILRRLSPKNDSYSFSIFFAEEIRIFKTAGVPR
jgi:hypothetical protein